MRSIAATVQHAQTIAAVLRSMGGRGHGLASELVHPRIATNVTDAANIAPIPVPIQAQIVISAARRLSTSVGAPRRIATHPAEVRSAALAPIRRNALNERFVNTMPAPTRKRTSSPKSRLSKKNSLVIGGAVLAILLACFVIHQAIASPIHVVRVATAALRSRDAEGLIRLATQSEVKALHTTPESISDCLNTTIWRDAHPDIEIKAVSSHPYYADILIVGVSMSGKAVASGTQRSELFVYQDRDGRWWLGLSMLLYNIHQACRPKGFDYGKEWDAIAHRSGLVGCTIPGGPTRYAATGQHDNEIRFVGDSARR